MERFKVTKVFMTLKDAARHQQTRIHPDRLKKLETERTGYAYLIENGQIWFESGLKIRKLEGKREPRTFDAARDAYLNKHRLEFGDTVRSEKWFKDHKMAYHLIKL